MYIDTHSHIFSNEFENNRDAVIKRAQEQGVTKIVLPNIDSSSIESLLRLSTQYEGYCYPLIGIHPTSVKTGFEKELLVVEEYLSKHKFYGIGEIGLDLYWDKSTIDIQKQALRYQLQLAKKHRLPVVIHTRNAFEPILEVFDSENTSELKGIFHSFSGTYPNYLHILEYGGFFFGIGGVVTYKNGGVDKVVERMKLEHIVLETDSPYLTPVPMRGKPNESAYITYVAAKVAELKGVTVEEVAMTTTRNAESIFSFNS